MCPHSACSGKNPWTQIYTKASYLVFLLQTFFDKTAMVILLGSCEPFAQTSSDFVKPRKKAEVLELVQRAL